MLCSFPLLLLRYGCSWRQTCYFYISKGPTTHSTTHGINMKKILLTLCLASPLIHAMEEQERQQRQDTHQNNRPISYAQQSNGIPHHERPSVRQAYQDSDCLEKCVGCCMCTALICCSYALASLGCKNNQ